MVESNIEAEIKIKFPCADYPIKVVSFNQPGVLDEILSVLSEQAEYHYKESEFLVSKEGKYRSFTFYILATGEKQLADINTYLRKITAVKTVL